MRVRPLPTTLVFTFAELVALGWTRSAVRNAVRVGRLTRLRAGVFCAGPPSPDATVLAAARAYPRAVVSHRSALVLYRLPQLGRPPCSTEMTVPPRASVTMPGVHVYRASVLDADRTVVSGAAVTTVARTLADTGRDVGLAAGVVAMDAALHDGLVTLREIEQTLGRCRSWPGTRTARQALALTDAAAESPLESISRLAFHSMGLPAPQSQVDIFDHHGDFLGRGDFGWAGLGVVGEADGKQKYRDPNDTDALVREKDRQEAIESTGLVVARWGWDEAWRRRPLLHSRMLSAFARARARDLAGVPRTWELRPSRRPAAFPP